MEWNFLVLWNSQADDVAEVIILLKIPNEIQMKRKQNSHSIKASMAHTLKPKTEA